MTQTWSALAPGSELRATVLMASGFVLPAGQRVEEHYRVARVLGEGAMGQVLAVTLVGGRRASDKQQAFALKVVARPADGAPDANEGPTTAAAREEAERDAHWLAELLRQEAAKQDEVQRHGVSVARLFALVQLEDGTIGLRMELARGRSLEAWLAAERARRDAPPDVLAALAVVRRLLSQLRRLHELASPESPSGFVHSDIKPGNVFVDDSDPSDPAITLLDFGVATAGQALVADLAMRQSSRQTFVLQQTGGTLGYAPPHHFSSGGATPLSDVYAALVILYELVALEVPWDYGALELSTEHLVQVEAAQLRGPRPVRGVRPSVPAAAARELDAFFAREFASLHAQAGEAAEVLAAAKDADDPARLALSARLVRLARQYQGALDALRAKLTGEPADAGATGPNPALPDSVLAPTPGDRHARPTVARTPGAARRDATAAPRWMRSIRVRRGAIGAAAVLLAATVVGLYVRARNGASHALAPRAERADAAVAAVDAAGTAPLVAAVPDAGAPAAPPVAPEVSLETLRNAPVVALPSRLRERAGGARATASSTARAVDAGVDAGASAASASGQPCVCLAPARGAHVVAHGGLLGREVVVCTARESVAEGRAQYFGRGSIAQEVTAALATFACRAPDGAAMQLVVGRYGARGGMELLLECRPVRVEPPPAPPPSAPPEPTASDASTAANVERTDAASGPVAEPPDSSAQPAPPGAPAEPRATDADAPREPAPAPAMTSPSPASDAAATAP